MSAKHLVASLSSVFLSLLGGSTAHAQIPPDVQIFHLFSGGSAGANPVSPVIQTPDGSLVGLSFGTGQFKETPGYLFKISPTGQFTTLHTFPADESQGGYNYVFFPAGIMQASDQNFYGTFPAGGQIGAGTLFRISPTGAYHQLHDFSGDGNEVMGPVVEAFDKNLYGVVRQGPGRSPEAIYRVGLDGTFSYVYIFDPAAATLPTSGLVLGPDGGLYGTAQNNFYRYDPASGTLTAVGSVVNFDLFGNFIPVLGPNNRAYFSDTDPDFCNCPQGAIISLGLDGGGPTFDYIYQNGTAPGNLTLAGDGKFYAASAYGSESYGSVADVTKQTDTASSLAGIGTNLNGNLTQISNGSFAGAVIAGGVGKANAGTVFVWNAGAPKPAASILGFQPLNASVGQTATVWGGSFVGTTAVSINGVPASFKTAASGFINFTVPVGAGSGPISITNAGGSTSSSGILTVQ